MKILILLITAFVITGCVQPEKDCSSTHIISGSKMVFTHTNEEVRILRSLYKKASCKQRYEIKFNSDKAIIFVYRHELKTKL